MQFLEVIVSAKASQTKQVNNTFSFFIRHFSMLRTLTLKCGYHQSLNKQDFTVLHHAKTNLYIDVSTSTGRSPSLVLSNTSIQSTQRASQLLRKHTFCHVSSDHDNTVSHAQTGNLLRGFKIWAVEKAISYVHHQTGCGLRQILG